LTGAFYCFNSLTNPINQPPIPGTIARTWLTVLLLTDTAVDRCYDKPVAPCPPMSEEQLKAFLEKVQGDTSLQEKLKAAADAEAVTAIVREAGFSLTAEDLKMGLSKLSDAELETAAGGFLCPIVCPSGFFGDGCLWGTREEDRPRGW